MNALDVLNELARRRVYAEVVARRGTGWALVLDDPEGAVDDALDAAIRDNRALVVAQLVGRGTGHALGPCSVCGELSMVATKRKGERYPRCRMTPRCQGRHIPPGARPAPRRTTTVIEPRKDTNR